MISVHIKSIGGLAISKSVFGNNQLPHEVPVPLYAITAFCIAHVMA
jgi:hypothetical protein